MRPQLPTVAALIATVAFLFASPSFAGEHRPHSIRVAKAEPSPHAVGARACETRAFPTPESGGFVCYGPSAIRAASGNDVTMRGSPQDASSARLTACEHRAQQRGFQE